MSFRMNGESFGSNHNQKLDSLRELFPRKRNQNRTTDCHNQILAIYAYRAANDLPVCADNYDEMEFRRDDMTALADDAQECNVDYGARIDEMAGFINEIAKFEYKNTANY